MSAIISGATLFREAPPLETTAATAPPSRRLGLLPRLLRTMLRWVLERLFVFQIRGIEHLPRGGFILAANHPAWLETFTLLAFVRPERGLRIMASRVATTDVGWRRLFVEQADAVLPLDVENGGNRAAIRAAVEQLRSGAAVGIFPEDLTEPTPPSGTIRPLQRGVAFLARASGCPVVPVGIADTRELWRGRRIRLNVGPPLDPPRERREDEAFLTGLAEQIEALRPPAEPLPAHRPWPWLSRLF